MEQRKFSPAEVLCILEGEVPTIVCESPREPSVDLFFGTSGPKYLLVVVDRDSRNVITVRPLSRKEKEAFKKEIGSG